MDKRTIVHLHAHTPESNGNGYFEVVTQDKAYIEAALKMGSPAYCITNHGNVASWSKRKMLAEAVGLKYIHGIEAYATESLEEKVRDNYHITLLAKNWEGVKEINKLSSKSFGGRGLDNGDNHYYYNPRMSFDEISNTSDNVIILTACLGSPLYQNLKNKNAKNLKKWMNFFVENKHRVWLEVQPHLHEEQKTYNKFLLRMAKEYGMNIVATNDVHALDEEDDKLRQIMKISKKAQYDEEDAFDLWYKSREAMEESFREQGVLTEEQIQTAIDNTLIIADSIEEFELDRSFKYPQMFENPLQKFKELIAEGYITRGINSKSAKEQKVYKDRVLEELKVYIKTDSINYMLLEWDVKTWAISQGYYPGYGRGSVSGSLIAYLLNITEMDSVRLGLNFTRFMNPARIGLADVDSDYFSTDRMEVQKYLLEHKSLNTASIMTINTYGVKGAIDAIGRGYVNADGQPIYSYSEIEEIKSQLIEEGTKVIIPEYLKSEHPILFKYVERVVGVIDSFGRHAAGIIVSTRDIEEEIGTMRLAKWDYPVSQWAMKEIDASGYVKLDILGLDNMGLINKTAQLAGLDRLTPDSENIDFEDEKVWMSMAEDNIGIFQFEGVRAGKIMKEVFSKETLAKIKSKDPNVKYLDILSLANASMRPAGSSFIDDVQQGNFKDNGHEALNKFLAPTLGQLVYQEDQTKFLVDFCGWDESHADVLRKGIGKKLPEVMDREVPKIKPAFIDTMVSKYNDSTEHAEEVADSFIQVFMDAVNYGFSINHSMAYSYIGYICGWLRYYYPLEFCTAALEVWDNDLDKTKRILDYAEKHDITLAPPTFRYSRGNYFFDKDTNTIYQGTAPIKGNNAQVGELLYEMSNMKFDSFTDLLLHIRDQTDLIVGDNKYTLSDIYSMSEDDIKALDKTISSAMKYKDFDPYNDKTVLKRYQKYINSGDVSEEIAELMEGMDIDDENANRALFDVWLNKYDKGKHPWEVEYPNVEIKQTSLPINKTKIMTLVYLDFFREFGNSKKLAMVFEKFNDSYKAKNKTFKGKAEKYRQCKEYEAKLDVKDYSIIEKLDYQNELTGRMTLKSKEIPPKYAYVAEIVNSGKTRVTTSCYLINKGVYQEVKVGTRIYRNVPFEAGDLIEIREWDLKPKVQRVNGAYVKSETEKELWATSIKMIRRAPKKEEE